MHGSALVLSIMATLAGAGVAQAATVRVTNDHDAVYQAASGEANSVTVEPGGPVLTFDERWAPLFARTGCVQAVPVVCGTAGGPPLDALLRLGDRDDVAAARLFIGTVTIDGGTGHDDLLASATSATVYGGTGDDTLRTSVENDSTATGGSGDDDIAGGPSAMADNFQGNDGADLLVPAGASRFNVALGGNGDDRLIAADRAGGGELRGGNGNDLLAAEAGSTFSGVADGGTGNDIIIAPAGTMTVTAGSGHDAIDAADGNAGDTVDCGSGFDVVWADADDTVAANCEHRIAGPAPALPGVGDALAAAAALRAHTP
jgi:Ca2+-binding RTX toxin-like protein